MVDQFGRRLFETFFKTYTEKVWGIPCTQIGATGPSNVSRALVSRLPVINALFKPKRTCKTLVDEFIYPRLGAGQLYEKMAANVTHWQPGHDECPCSRIRRDNHASSPRLRSRTERPSAMRSKDAYFLVSAPLTEMIEMMSSEPPSEVLSACCALRYRNHVGVNLIVEGRPFPDNWIYVHSKEVGMARIANYAQLFTGDVRPAGLIR